MALTFEEYYGNKTGLTVGINKVLFQEDTPYQSVEIFETDTWGKMLVIDGMVMLSEKDEFVYHELLTHVALFTHPHPKKVLIIGGGDGGTARETMKHRSVEVVDLVEIDETVIDASQKFLPEIGDWDNPKLNIHVEDGTQFIEQADSVYDIIIIDGSDPVGPAESLFEDDFVQNCYNALSVNGVLTAQTESPWVNPYHKSIKNLYESMDKRYPVVKMYLGYIPLYPAGMWSFIVGSKKSDPLADDTMARVKNGLDYFGDTLRYYNEEIHSGSFSLPQFVKKIIS